MSALSVALGQSVLVPWSASATKRALAASAHKQGDQSQVVWRVMPSTDVPNIWVKTHCHGGLFVDKGLVVSESPKPGALVKAYLSSFKGLLLYLFP